MLNGTDKPWVIVQTHNNMPLISETLQKLQSQDLEFQLMVCDSSSDDGTLDEVRKYTDHILQFSEGDASPAKKLNQAMKHVNGEVVVFLHPEAVPLNRHWLSDLITAMDNPRIAAVFSRQVARPDHCLIHIKDSEDFFGDGSRQKYTRHCFSLVSAAIRRSLWEKSPFNEDFQSSTGFYWTWHARMAGYTIRYVPDSMVMYSRDYKVKDYYLQNYDEGRTEALLFDWGKWDSAFLNYSLFPYGRQVLSDWKYCLPKWALKTVLYAPILRMARMLGRRRGFKTGLRKRKKKKT
ncbi:MAG: glycosyltransferase [Candidatus Omnitrophica bacterium]|nr:glycosyltransferase [Candidatus Omnitrophota bacterium]